jgi:hypothetical protein
MNFWPKTPNDTHQKCMNDHFFHVGYSPEMYECLINLEVWQVVYIFSHSFLHFFGIWDVRGENMARRNPWGIISLGIWPKKWTKITLWGWGWAIRTPGPPWSRIPPPPNPHLGGKVTHETCMNGLEKCMNFGKIHDFLLLTYIGACQGPE